MKFIKWFFILSLAANAVLCYMLFTKQEAKPAADESMSLHMVDVHEMFRDSTYRRFFIEKNDAVYRDYYVRSFEETPVQAFMIACTYYMLTKKESVKADINAVDVELKAIYGKAPDIKYCK